MPIEDVNILQQRQIDSQRLVLQAAGRLLAERDIQIKELEERIELLDRAYEHIAGIRYSELERRAKHMYDHPDEAVSHEEAMASLREDRPARTIREMREKSSEAETDSIRCVHCGSNGPTHNDCPVYGDNAFDGDEKKMNMREKSSEAETTPEGMEPLTGERLKHFLAAQPSESDHHKRERE